MTERDGAPMPNDVSAKPRVLIVDDERKNRQLIEIMLGEEHYELTSVASAEEALLLIGAGPPDIVLLDVMMPGMDGYQVAARIKGDPATQHVPIIMLSALNDRNSISHGRAAGAESFIGKPVNGGELRREVQKLLGEAKRA